MNVIDKVYRVYYSLPNFNTLGKFGKGINRIIALLFKKFLDPNAPKELLDSSQKDRMGINSETRNQEIIVSLTSFPARINDVWIVIECLFRQTVKPDKIVLWLGSEKFRDKSLPDNLTKLCNKGLEIRFCEDLRSHTKYYYIMKENPESYIITFDDDLYLDRNVIKNLIDLNSKFPNCICTNRGHKMTLNNDDSLKKYSQWCHNTTKSEPAYDIFPTGCNGVLYPPKALHEEVFNKDVFKKYCYFADDVWLKIMACKKGTKAVTNKRYNKDPISIQKSQTEKLVTSNVKSGGNDKQLQDVCEFYDFDINKMILNKNR